MSAQKPVVRKKDLFTRARAERALSAGADPTEERFTKHQNKHVRAKAAKIATKPAVSVARFVREINETLPATSGDEAVFLGASS